MFKAPFVRPELSPYKAEDDLAHDNARSSTSPYYYKNIYVKFDDMRIMYRTNLFFRSVFTYVLMQATTAHR